MNAADIKANQAALASATENDWSSCAAAMQSVSVTSTPRRCGSKESAIAVMQAGGNHVEMMDKLTTDKTGNLLYLRLADGSSEGGIVWAEPDLTVPYMQSRVADFTQPVIDALVSLSQQTTFPFSGITADDCQRAWIIDACLSPIVAAHAAAAAKLNNASASLMVEHTDGLTLQELQARCDAITASEDGAV